MTNSHDSAEGAFGLDARDAQRLRQAVPELDDWPRSWHVEPGDIAVGEQIVQVLTPFGLHLQDQGQARGTVSRHRDILWTSTLTKTDPSVLTESGPIVGARPQPRSGVEGGLPQAARRSEPLTPRRGK